MIPNAVLFKGNKQYPIWRLAIVHWVAKGLGIRIHADDMPYGSLRLRKKFPEPPKPRDFYVKDPSRGIL